MKSSGLQPPASSQPPALILTLDYELPENGAGDPRRHMIQPTARLMDICAHHGARLTIMAEMGEIRAFEDPAHTSYLERLGYDAPAEIRAQLAEAVSRGHDVQLHLHPQWLGARWRRDHWELDYAHYQLTSLAAEAAAVALRRGREDLEKLLRPCDPDYACIGFRAGHWTTAPSDEYLAALVAAGLRSDTSVFKWGRATRATARYDYRHAHSHYLSWRADPADLNLHHPDGAILEVPIATRLASILSFLALKRLRIPESRSAGVRSADCGRRNRVGNYIRLLFSKHPLKFDFCKLTARQMSSFLDGLLAEISQSRQDACATPILAIGHSKQVGANPALARDLDRFLDHAAELYPDRLRFATYRQFVSECRRKPEIANEEARHATADAH